MTLARAASELHPTGGRVSHSIGKKERKTKKNGYFPGNTPMVGGVLGPTKRWASGCVNAGRGGKQEQKQNSPNLELQFN